MRAEEDWGIISSVRPEARERAPAWSAAMTRGQVVRAYTCKVCGYVEFYDAQIVEPGTWTSDAIAIPVPPSPPKLTGGSGAS